MYTATLLSYSKENVGNPEVVLYAHINENKKVEMKIYSSKESNNYTTLINPSLKDIIPLVQVGDVLTYTGHTFLMLKKIVLVKSLMPLLWNQAMEEAGHMLIQK